ncbi:DUF4118 domain-containing protein [Streptomyces catenulae]|uniref:DUF4118 domain-containing protein n=1 Tax=Streptomyces catenulae TaxID=66875 RepID=A0ABV2Z0Z0_9ACTN|nr:DUF4118 domain-containing protein [Streptomyces catenulae]
MVRYATRNRLALAGAVLLPPALCAALVPVRDALPHADAALIAVVAVVAVAALGNRVAGALAALSAAVWFDVLLTPPYGTLDITGTADAVTAALLLAVGLTVAQLAARARKWKVSTVLDDDYLAQIHHTARLAGTATSPDEVIDQVSRQLVGLLGLSGCRFEYGTLLGHPPRLEGDGSLSWGRRHWDVDRDGLPPTEVELRVLHNGRFHGRFLLRAAPGATPPLGARLVAVTLADQTGAAFDNLRPAPV